MQAFHIHFKVCEPLFKIKEPIIGVWDNIRIYGIHVILKDRLSGRAAKEDGNVYLNRYTATSHLFDSRISFFSLCFNNLFASTTCNDWIYK